MPLTCRDIYDGACMDPPEATFQVASRLAQRLFGGRTIVTDRQTDRPRCSVFNNRLRIRSTAMRRNHTRTVVPECCKQLRHFSPETATLGPDLDWTVNSP